MKEKQPSFEYEASLVLAGLGRVRCNAMSRSADNRVPSVWLSSMQTTDNHAESLRRRGELVAWKAPVKSHNAVVLLRASSGGKTEVNSGGGWSLD